MSIVKQITFKGVDEQGNVNCLPLFVGGMEKTAAKADLSIRSSKLHPRIKDFVSAIRPTKHGIYILVNALGASEYWGQNSNGDVFPEEALIHAPPDWEKLSPEKMKEVGSSWPYGFPTFMAAKPYTHHANKDTSRALGEVVLAVWNPEMHRVELVIYLDRSRCEQQGSTHVIERIERGEFPDVSMGCKVPFDICTICGFESSIPRRSISEPCRKCGNRLNVIFPDGRKVGTINTKPKFFDISVFVYVGADKTAKVMAKLAEKQDGRVCMGDFCSIPRASSEIGEMFSKEAGAQVAEALPEDFRSLWNLIKTAEDKPETNPVGADEYRSAAGGLTQKGREHFKRTEGANLKPGVRGPADTPEKMRRKGSFLSRMFGPGAPGAMTDEQGRPSRRALSAQAWGEPTPKNDSDRAALYAKGQSLLARYKAGGEKQAAAILGKPHPPIKHLIPAELHAGEREEKEHTTIPGLPKEIALDHLAENAHYYSKLHEAGLMKEPVEKKSSLTPAEMAYLGTGGALSGLGLGAVLADHAKRKAKEHEEPMTPKESKRALLAYSLGSGVLGAAGTLGIGHLLSKLADKKPPEEPTKGIWRPDRARQDAGREESPLEVNHLQKEAKSGNQLFYDALNGTHCTGSCGCGGHCDLTKIAGVSSQKIASHRKLADIIKEVPAGPFVREHLPKLESAEHDIPDHLLDLMGGSDLGSALSTPGMMGIVLKPREFQRVMLIRIGEKPFADDLDRRGVVFGPTDEIDESIPFGHSLISGLLQKALMPLFAARSAAAPVIRRRVIMISMGGKSPQKETTEDRKDPTLKKIAALYNGYRASLVKKASSIQKHLVSDSQLLAALSDGSMAQAFAGGIEKTASRDVFGPESLAYLMGVHRTQDAQISDVERASLAHLGAFKAAAA